MLEQNRKNKITREYFQYYLYYRDIKVRGYDVKNGVKNMPVKLGPPLKKLH